MCLSALCPVVLPGDVEQLEGSEKITVKIFKSITMVHESGMVVLEVRCTHACKHTGVHADVRRGTRAYTSGREINTRHTPFAGGFVRWRVNCVTSPATVSGNTSQSGPI